MTNKSIRDYINLIENAQREGVAEGSTIDDEIQHWKDMALHWARMGNQEEARQRCLRKLKAAEAKKKQGVAEATGNTGLPHDFTAVQPGAEVWYKGRFAGWTTGKVYDDPYGKAGKMVAFEPNPSEFPGDDGRILSLPYDEVSLRKSTSIGKLKGPGQGVAEEQVEESSPEAIAKINELTRRP